MLSKSIITDLSKNLEEPTWLLDRRLQAYEIFKEMDMPSFKYGIGIFVDISGLQLEEINPLNNFDKEIIISEEVEILTFKEAILKHEDLIKEYFMTKCVLPNENKFTALHAAFFNKGILMIIPENKELTKPIQIKLNINSKSRLDHILIIAEKNSKAIIIEASGSQEENGQLFRSQVVEVILKENSYLEYISLQNINKSIYNFSKRKAHVETNSFMYWVDCSIGSKFTQSITSTNLIGLGAIGKSWSVIFGDQEQCYDINNETKHIASKTTSEMLTRVVLNDKAKTVYRGLIKISPKAVNCEGYQKDDTILLSENAKADVVPNLEIANNEVKCSHGATISQIDDDKLFYMMSRGIDDKTAKKAIIEGFFDPIMAKIVNEEMKQEIIDSISKRLGSLN